MPAGTSDWFDWTSIVMVVGGFFGLIWIWWSALFRVIVVGELSPHSCTRASKLLSSYDIAHRQKSISSLSSALNMEAKLL